MNQVACWVAAAVICSPGSVYGQVLEKAREGSAQMQAWTTALAGGSLDKSADTSRDVVCQPGVAEGASYDEALGKARQQVKQLFHDPVLSGQINGVEEGSQLNASVDIQTGKIPLGSEQRKLFLKSEFKFDPSDVLPIKWQSTQVAKQERTLPGEPGQTAVIYVASVLGCLKFPEQESFVIFQNFVLKPAISLYRAGLSAKDSLTRRIFLTTMKSFLLLVPTWFKDAAYSESLNILKRDLLMEVDKLVAADARRQTGGLRFLIMGGPERVSRMGADIQARSSTYTVHVRLSDFVHRDICFAAVNDPALIQTLQEIRLTSDLSVLEVQVENTPLAFYDVKCFLSPHPKRWSSLFYDALLSLWSKVRHQRQNAVAQLDPKVAPPKQPTIEAPLGKLKTDTIVASTIRREHLKAGQVVRFVRKARERTDMVLVAVLNTHPFATYLPKNSIDWASQDLFAVHAQMRGLSSIVDPYQHRRFIWRSGNPLYLIEERGGRFLALGPERWAIGEIARNLVEVQSAE